MQAVKIPFLAHPWHKFPEQFREHPASKNGHDPKQNCSIFYSDLNQPALSCLLNLNSKVHQRRSIHAHAHKVERKWEKLAPCSSSLFLQSSARTSNIIKTIMQMRLNFFWRIFSGTIHSFYRLRSTIAFVIGSTITSSKIVWSTQKKVYSIYIYTILV